MMNQLLVDLYTKYESAIFDIKSRCNDELEGPFLIAPNDAYWSSATKVAFVGQETRGWESWAEISEQMAVYKKFNLGERYFSSPFWNVIEKLESKLTGSTLSSAWLNLNRYDQDGKPPSIGNQRILSDLDFLLLDELKLVAPDIVIFFTGPKYDPRINGLLQGNQIAIDGFSPRELCKIASPFLPALTFRTYHPNFLRRSGREKRFVEAICAEFARTIN
jgi:hypothetical protein